MAEKNELTLTVQCYGTKRLLEQQTNQQRFDPGYAPRLINYTSIAA